MNEPAPESDRSLIALAIDRPVAVTMIVLAVAVFGFVSFRKLSLTLLPKISYPSLTVRTEYPGSAPAEVEELVTKPLEEFLSVISNLNGYRSISRAGVSDVILEFEWDTNMSFAAQDVREKVDQVRPLLPQDINKPLLLKYDPTLDPVMRFGLYGKSDLAEIRYHAEERLKKQLESIPGVAAIRVRGGFESEIRIDIDERALRQHRVSVMTLQSRLQEENVNLASGVLREGDVEYLVRTLSQFRSLREIQRMVVDVQGDRLVRLEDVARVRRTNKEPDVVTRINGEPSVEMAIYKEDSANIVEVAHAVKRTLFGAEWRTRLVAGEYVAPPEKEENKKKEEEKEERGGGRGRRGGGGTQVRIGRKQTLVETLPTGMKLRLLSDQSRFIESSIKEVQMSGLYGALFAILILFIFLRNVLSTIIIAVSIPVSIIATFGPMMQFDVTLNIMSLGGLALGIGMLVDASIVVLESIDRCRREGDDFREAAIRGTREVGGAVFASVLTTVAVFFPIIFVEGIAGEIFKDQSLTVVFSLMASLAVALFFIPMLAARQIAGLQAGKTWSRPDRAYFILLRDRVLKGWPSLHSARRYLRFAFRPGGGIRRVGAIVLLPFAALLFLAFLAVDAVGRVLYLGLLTATVVVLAPIVVVGRLVGFVLKPFGMLFDRIYAAVESGYALLLRGALSARLLVVIAAGILLAVTWRSLDRVGLELIPEMHSGEIIIEAPQAVGSSLQSTSRVAKSAERRIEAARDDGLDIVGYSTSVGVARDEIAPAGEGPHTSKIFLSLPIVPDMATAEERAIESVRAALSDLPEVGELTFTSPKLFTFSNPLEVQIKGDQLSRLETIGRALEARLAQVPGLADVQSTVQQGTPEFVIVYDRVKLADRGLTLAQAAGRLRDKIRGVVPTKFSVEDESRKIDILLKIPEEDVGNIHALKNVVVSPGDEDPIRLGEVAEVTQGRGPSEVRHVAGERAVLLTAVPEGIDLKTASDIVRNEVERLRKEDESLFRGVVVSIAGQTAEAERSSRELLLALALALVLVYIVMASQFESLLDPLVIMFSSLFAGVGAVFALIWLDIAASVVVFIGGIMLAGIVVNNAIVLVDCINRVRREGTSRREAIVEAGRRRLRPILMTTATTILGLLPMALSTGEGAEMRMPMAVTVIAGLATSTVLTLVIIPVVYSLAHDIVGWIRPDRAEAAA